MQKKHNAEVILRALLKGHDVEMTFPNGAKARAALSEEDDVCIVGMRDGREVLLQVDLSLNAFIKMCENLGDDEMFSTLAKLTMNRDRT